MDFRTVTVGLMAIAMGGCSSMPVSVIEATPVPPSRIFVPAIAGSAVDQADGTLTFLRDTGFGGGGCKHDVFVDSTKVFEIGVSEQFVMHLPAGRHLLRIQDATFLCPGTTTSLETGVMAGADQVYRIQLTGNQTVNLARIR